MEQATAQTPAKPLSGCAENWKGRFPYYKPGMSDAEFELRRFWDFVKIQENGCWLWTGNLKPKAGYGRFKSLTKRNHLAHIWCYENRFGPVPEGLELDHLCRNRACVNPEHLEAVTNVVNVMRGDGPPAINARKTHCSRGHPFEGDNLRKEGKYRRCLKCKQITNARRYPSNAVHA